MSDLEQLHELQLADSSLDHMAYRRAHLEVRLAFNAARAATAAARAALNANIARRGALDTQYGAVEAKGKEIDAKIARLDGQMRKIIVTREAEAIQREMATLKAEREHGDEVGFAMLEESEALSAQALDLDAALIGAQEAEAVAAATLAVGDAELDRETAELVAHRTELAASLPETLVAQYETRRPVFKGVAVARLQGTRCSGCHLDLSRLEIEAVWAVAAGQLPECPQCARILVR